MQKNILFDLDGTLIDPKTGITKCFQYALKNLDQPIPQTKQLLWVIGPGLRESFSKLLSTNNKEKIETAVSLYRERYSKHGVYENTLYPNVKKTLETLSKTHRLFLCTSKALYYAKIIIEQHKLTPYFSKLFGSELDGTRTDKKELIPYIIEKTGISPATSIMVGDKATDINAGKLARMETIVAEYGYGTQEELKDFTKEPFIKDFKEILDLTT